MSSSTPSAVADTTEVDDRLTSADDGYILDDEGLYCLRALTKTEWKALGLELARRSRKLQWQFGDWLVAGEFYREGLLDEAVRLTGYSRTHLTQLHHVARAFPRGERLAISWTHHAAVMGVTRHEDRVALLQQARQDRWTVDDLRVEIDRRFPPVGEVHGRETAGTRAAQKVVNAFAAKRKVRCPQCRHIFDPKDHPA